MLYVGYLPLVYR